MTPENRRVYRSLAFAFMVIGGVFIALSLLETFWALGLLRGNALPVALFLLLIGTALFWTARERSDEPEPPEDGA